MKNKQQGFTLVEIMIVVAIIGILAAIAIPYWLKSTIQSRAKACVNNLRILNDAKDQYAMENKKSNSDTYSIVDLTLYLRNSASTSCPSTGTQYSAGTSGKMDEYVICPNYNSSDSEFSLHIYPPK